MIDTVYETEKADMTEETGNMEPLLKKGFRRLTTLTLEEKVKVPLLVNGALPAKLYILAEDRVERDMRIIPEWIHLALAEVRAAM